MSVAIDAAGYTEQGGVRNENQDWFGIWAAGDEWVGAVADGMGGEPGGGPAAQAAIEAVERTAAAGNLTTCVEAATEAVALRTGAGGTTLSVAAVGPAGIRLAHVGDSRIYLVSAGEIRLLSRDHTVAGEADGGAVRGNPLRNRLTRAITGRPVSPFTAEMEITAPYTVLLCSDGVWEPLSDAQLLDLVSGGSAADTSRTVCESALAAGSRDNVTAVILAVRL